MRTRRWTAEVDGQTLEFILRDVDPELAEEYLGYNKRNRRAKKALIDSLTIDMTESAFRFNGDTVRFDSDGTLIDGQHRLRAIIASGATVPMLIIDGFDPSVMDTVDQGISRTVLDILATHSVTSANMSVMASTAAILVLGDRKLSTHIRDRKLIASFVEKNIGLLEETSSWAKRVSTASPRTEIESHGKKQKSLSPSPLAALRIHMATAGAEDGAVVTFFEKLATLRMPDDETENASLRIVRSWLAKTRPLIRGGGTAFPRMLSVYQVLINSYNRIQEGEAIERIRIGDETLKYFDDLPAPNE